MSDKSVTLDLMKDPINLQKYVLDSIIDKIENRTNFKDLTLVDPNSVFVHLVESHTTIVSQLANLIQDEFDRRNVIRAQTDADLYLHMSDFDFIGSFATPSKINVTLTVDKNYIIQEGVNVNDNYSVLIIPKDTVITIGTLTFGLYYPIRIQVDRRTKIPLVTYDIEEQNPLFPLKSNRIIFQENKYMTYSLLMMNLTVYQFTKTVKTDSLDYATGYSKAFDYTDEFYAVRLFSIKDGVSTELAQSMVEDNYDPYKPTARVEVETDKKRFVVTIPLIYFTKGLMGTKLEIHLFTTKGNIAVNVGSAPVDQCKLNFNITEKTATDYNRPLMRMPLNALNITTYTTADGTDGYSFEEKRLRIINDSFQTKLLVTPQDLEQHYSTYGIKVTKYLDNLTNLIYFAYKALTDSNGTIIPTSNSYLRLVVDDYNDVNTITRNPDQSITVCPKTLWKFKENADMCIPVTNDELSTIFNKTKEDQILLFNSDKYVYSPFHIRLNTDVTYPKATSYNLMNPTTHDVTIDSENVEIAAQMLVVSEYVKHLDNGSGGYQVYFVVKKDILEDVPEDEIYVYVYCITSEGISVGIKADYVEDPSSHGFTVDSENGYCLYTFWLNTDYWLDEHGNISITTLSDNRNGWSHLIPLTNRYTVVFMVKNTNFPNVNTLPSLFEGVPNELQENRIVLLRQSLNIELGYGLDDVVYNNVNITKSEIVYSKYDHDIPLTYPYDVYATDSDGNLKIDIDSTSGELVTYIEHRQDAVVHDDNGNVVYKHREGDKIENPKGDDIVQKRIQQYLIMAPIIDAKVYVSQNPVQKNFISNVCQYFEQYFNIVRNASGYISERTKIYFRPSRTMGNTRYSLGDGVEFTAPLDLYFKFRIMVSDGVIASKQLQDTIRESVILAIEKHLTDDVISQTEIIEEIKNLTTYISSIDAYGINGDIDLQTLSPIDKSVQPTIRQDLYLTNDGEIYLRKRVDIQYVTKNS